MAIFPTLPSLALLFLLEILLLPSASAHRTFNPYAPGVVTAAAATPVQLPPLVLNFTSSLFSALHGASNGGNGGGGGVFVDEVTGENHQIIALKEQQQKPPPPPLLPISEFIDIPPNPDPILEHRRRFLVNMTRHAWAAYANASWGEAELHPLSSSSKNSSNVQNSETPKSGKSIFAALSTLWVMGLTEEFTAGVDWLDREMNSTLVVEEGLWEVPGALLSLYALTGNGFFLTKARGLAEKFKVEENNNLWGYSRLWTATRLEYRYLSDLTNSPRFIKQVAKIEKLLNNGTSSSSSTIIEHDQIRLEQSTGNSLMLMVKAYLQSGGSLHSKTLKRELYDVLDRLISSGYIGSLEHSPDHLVTIRMSPARPTMYSWHCLLGGVLSLAGELLPEVHHLKTGWPTVDELHHRRLLLRAEHLLQLGANLTESCHRVAASTPTGLPFGQFKLVVNETMISKGNSSSSSAEKTGGEPLPHPQKPKLTIFGNGGYWLSSQLAETYFLLFRLTGQRRYQDYAWQLAQAINRHAKVTSGPGRGGGGGGFAEVAKVDRLPVERFLDRQPAEFLSATLKYLYLTFTPAHFISLKQWVLNAQGHPLPICGRNWAYPGGVCGGGGGAKHEEIAIV